MKVRLQLAVAVALLYAAYAAADTGAVALTASAPVLSNAPATAEATAEKPAMKIAKSHGPRTTGVPAGMRARAAPLAGPEA